MSKLSDKLFYRTRKLWNIAAENEFVRAMADGSLEIDRFKAYLKEDYFYLVDYIDILVMIKDKVKNIEVRDFLSEIIDITIYEKDVYHMEKMKKIGITDQEIDQWKMGKESKAYLEYMKSLAIKGGIQGITALLQCSWSYAYIAKKVSDEYGKSLAKSPYASWFNSYVSEEYTEANDRWIHIVDSLTEDISESERDELCQIFEKCAEYEINFWNIFHS